MKLFAPLRVRIEKNVIARVHRNLVGEGKIFVSKNQEVTPSDIIASTNVSAGFRNLNLAESLKVAPSEVQKYMKRSLGQRIYKGELLAARTSFFGGKKIVISPTDGVLDFLNPKTGEIRMSFLPKKADLPASVFGIVDSIDQQRGQIVIRTQVSIVHGMFGSGRIRDGVLRLIGRRDGLISKSFISPKYEGQILVGGSLVFRDGITSAISSSVAGIITGGANAEDYKSMAGGKLVFPKKIDNDIGVSVIACEGFGSLPIGDDIYEILSIFDGKFISVDGNRALIYLPSFSSSSLIAVRKSAIPPQGLVASDTLPQMSELSLGLRVRIIGNSYCGQQGKIVALDKTETKIISGINTFLVTIETKRRKIQVPVANLEIIL